MSPAPQPLWFTFGNHMHWVDMQWLWGYQVLPDSVDDMLALCAAVGAKGNVNFDAVGYEKLAGESPEALARLRAAVAAGTIEVVGGSYGQPYGLFQGGESNVRQRVYGARTVRRLLGVWPRTFWEEEFDFCPQLPQILKSCGFTGASLFFQWTWHTPTVPEETVPLVQWEGVDGTRLPALAKTDLCLHQWPEDFDGRLELAAKKDRPALVQWLELMPSKDWMCRSELLLPRLRDLFADRRFQVRAATAGELIAALDDGKAPVRAYTLDDVFHGMTIGKNGDCVPRLSDDTEACILAAESLAATLGLVGRPYASWDVYPAWELDEAWRELLAAQHHDNHECEGLCGAIGKHSFARAASLAGEVAVRSLRHLAQHVAVDGDRLVVVNPCGWPRDIQVAAPESWGDGPDVLCRLAAAVPPFGWATIRRTDNASIVRAAATMARRPDGGRTLTDADLSAAIDGRGQLTQIRSGDAVYDLAIGTLRLRVGDKDFTFGKPTVDAGDGGLSVRYGGDGTGHDVELTWDVDATGVHLAVRVLRLPRPDPGFGGALRLVLGKLADGTALRADSPYAVAAVAPAGEHRRKYPSGDWMTSEQWFEPVRGAFTARTFVDVTFGDGRSLQCVHDGSQGWFVNGKDLEAVLFAYDPWDEARWEDPAATDGGCVAHFHFLPHRALAASACIRAAEENRGRGDAEPGQGKGGALPATFGPLFCTATNVVVTAFHREHQKAFEHVERAFGPAVRNPFVVRLVEYDGIAGDVQLTVAGACPLAAVTDALGRVERELRAEACAPPAWSPPGLPWSQLTVPMRARGIATVMLDLELGRHLPRNLDDHRHVWATVHRT